jgi:hypothetical protein
MEVRIRRLRTTPGAEEVFTAAEAVVDIVEAAEEVFTAAAAAVGIAAEAGAGAVGATGASR